MYKEAQSSHLWTSVAFIPLSLYAEQINLPLKSHALSQTDRQTTSFTENSAEIGILLGAHIIQSFNSRRLSGN